MAGFVSMYKYFHTLPKKALHSCMGSIGKLPPKAKYYRDFSLKRFIGDKERAKHYEHSKNMKDEIGSVDNFRFITSPGHYNKGGT